MGQHLKLSFESLFSYIHYARILIQQNKYTSAEALMSEIYAIAKNANGIERLIDLKSAYTLMYIKRKEHEKAVTEYIDALEMAAEENLLIHFLLDLDQY